MVISKQQQLKEMGPLQDISSMRKRDRDKNKRTTDNTSYHMTNALPLGVLYCTNYHRALYVTTVDLQIIPHVPRHHTFYYYSTSLGLNAFVPLYCIMWRLLFLFCISSPLLLGNSIVPQLATYSLTSGK